MGFATRVSFKNVYPLWNSRQGWGLVVISTVLIIIYRLTEVKTFL